MASKSSKGSQGPGKLAKTYLFLYNILQVMGWTYVLYQLVAHYTISSSDATLWETVKPTLLLFQNAALLEIVHAATRIVSSSVVTTAFQILSRVIVVGGALAATPTAPASTGLPLALVAWAVTEVIRYLFYALGLVGTVPAALTWLRYTTFIVLYPVGVTGELLCLHAAQSYAAASGQWSWSLPNAANFAFSYQYCLLLVMLLYIPLFPQLYLHMFSLRRKVLGRGSAAATPARKAQ